MPESPDQNGQAGLNRARPRAERPIRHGLKPEGIPKRAEVQALNLLQIVVMKMTLRCAVVLFAFVGMLEASPPPEVLHRFSMA